MHKIKINVNNGERRSVGCQCPKTETAGGVRVMRRMKAAVKAAVKAARKEHKMYMMTTAAICCCSLLVFACTYAK